MVSRPAAAVADPAVSSRLPVIGTSMWNVTSLWTCSRRTPPGWSVTCRTRTLGLSTTTTKCTPGSGSPWLPTPCGAPACVPPARPGAGACPAGVAGAPATGGCCANTADPAIIAKLTAGSILRTMWRIIVNSEHISNSQIATPNDLIAYHLISNVEYSQHMDFSNRVAVVTGSKRIGAVVAIELARRGADVAVCYNRSKAEADKTAETVKALGRRAFIKQANLTRAEDCESFINESAAALGRLDILVNMASIYVSIPFDELTVAQY